MPTRQEIDEAMAEISALHDSREAIARQEYEDGLLLDKLDDITDGLLPRFILREVADAVRAHDAEVGA